MKLLAPSTPAAIDVATPVFAADMVEAIIAGRQLVKLTSDAPIWTDTVSE